MRDSLLKKDEQIWKCVNILFQHYFHWILLSIPVFYKILTFSLLTFFFSKKLTTAGWICKCWYKRPQGLKGSLANLEERIPEKTIAILLGMIRKVIRSQNYVAGNFCIWECSGPKIRYGNMLFELSEKVFITFILIRFLMDQILFHEG